MRSQPASVSHLILRQPIGAALAGLAWPFAIALALMLSPGVAQAQSVAKPVIEAAPQAVPGFWDPRRRPDRTDLSRLNVIRFLNEYDYHPFHFTGPDGTHTGFNVYLARLLFEEI